MSNTFEYDQPQTLSIQWFDKAGKPTTAPTGVVPTWALSDTNSATLVIAAGGETCALTGLNAGTTTATMTAGPIVATLPLTLTPGKPVTAQIVVAPTVAA
jgi:hypothetical protein